MRLSRIFAGLKRADDLSQVVPAFGDHQLVELVDEPLGDSRVVEIGRPTWIAEAPQTRKSSTSSIDAMPPTPMMGTRTARATCHTARSARGLMARSAQTAESSAQNRPALAPVDRQALKRVHER